MANSSIRLEVCASSIESALNAESGGADRIELCTSLQLGGQTPSYGELILARNLLKTPIHVLIRPRAGDYTYNDNEIEIMVADIELCAKLKMDGIVVGALDANGNVDKKVCSKFIDAARGMSLTFHRAFDICRDPFAALEDIISMGFDRILTSGQQNSALSGAQLIAMLNERSAGRISIMAGAGITEKNIKQIIEITKVKEFHASAKRLDARKSTATESITTTDKEIVKKIKEVITPYR